MINQTPKNLGLVAHVSLPVGNVLNQYSPVVTIEVHIELSDKFYVAIFERI